MAIEKTSDTLHGLISPDPLITRTQARQLPIGDYSVHAQTEGLRRADENTAPRQLFSRQLAAAGGLRDSERFMQPFRVK